MSEVKQGDIVFFECAYGSCPEGIERGVVYVATVLRPLSDEECDPECQPMWRLALVDREVDAFEDEIGFSL